MKELLANHQGITTNRIQVKVSELRNFLVEEKMRKERAAEEERIASEYDRRIRCSCGNDNPSSFWADTRLHQMLFCFTLVSH